MWKRKLKTMTMRLRKKTMMMRMKLQLLPFSHDELFVVSLLSILRQDQPNNTKEEYSRRITKQNEGEKHLVGSRRGR